MTQEIQKMNELFEKAITIVLEHEGGYSNNPEDPGGETNFGICKKQYPNEDIANLTKDKAKEIYLRDYWNPYKWASLPDVLAVKVFDLSVVMGAKPASKMLQRACRACGVPLIEDGDIGHNTLEAVAACPNAPLLAATKSEAAGHFRGLVKSNPDLSGFLEGWLNRAYS